MHLRFPIVSFLSLHRTTKPPRFSLHLQHRMITPSTAPATPTTTTFNCEEAREGPTHSMDGSSCASSMPLSQPPSFSRFITWGSSGRTDSDVSSTADASVPCPSSAESSTRARSCPPSLSYGGGCLPPVAFPSVALSPETHPNSSIGSRGGGKHRRSNTELVGSASIFMRINETHTW